MNRNKPIEVVTMGGQLPRKKEVQYAGRRLVLYSIGYFTLLAAIAKVTLRVWERKGIMPRPIFQVDKNRWYSPREIEVYTAVIRNHYQQRGRGLIDLKRDLHAASIDCKRHYVALSKGKEEFPLLRNEETLMEKIREKRIAKMV